MTDKITVYHTAPLRAESGNGVLEYVYQVSREGRDQIDFKFVYFSDEISSGRSLEVVEGFEVLAFPKPTCAGFILPKAFLEWLDTECEPQALFHLHSVFSPANYALGRALAGAGKNYVFTPHDSYSPESMVKSGCLKRLYLNTFEKRLMDRAAVLHALTPVGAGYIAKRTNNDRIETVTNFVSDPAVGTPGPAGAYACFVGRYDFHQKGIDSMLAVLGRLKADGGRIPPFKIVGKYSAADSERLTGLMHKNQLSADEVVQVGRLSFEDKETLLREARFYFQLSRFEGFGLSIAEALSLGVPVVITEKVPISSIIKAHKAGFVVRSIDEAVAAVKRIQNMDTKECVAMRQAARQCYERNFHPKQVMPKLYELYKSALGA